MLSLIDKLQYSVLVPITIALAIAPVRPEPHLTEKLRMLRQGTLTRPLDIFDLLLHSIPILVLLLKIVRDIWLRRHT